LNEIYRIEYSIKIIFIIKLKTNLLLKWTLILKVIRLNLFKANHNMIKKNSTWCMMLQILEIAAVIRENLIFNQRPKQQWEEDQVDLMQGKLNLCI